MLTVSIRSKQFYSSTDGTEMVGTDHKFCGCVFVDTYKLPRRAATGVLKWVRAREWERRGVSDIYLTVKVDARGRVLWYRDEQDRQFDGGQWWRTTPKFLPGWML